MSDFELDKELIISLEKARSVLWDKTVDIYKGKNEAKKASIEVRICLKEDFEAPRDDKKKDAFTAE
jgi:hypothetical protein